MSERVVQWVRGRKRGAVGRRLIGLHHTALISSDVEKTIEFYQGVLEFPLTEADSALRPTVVVGTALRINANPQTQQGRATTRLQFGE